MPWYRPVATGASCWSPYTWGASIPRPAARASGARLSFMLPSLSLFQHLVWLAQVHGAVRSLSATHRVHPAAGTHARQAVPLGIPALRGHDLLLFSIAGNSVLYPFSPQVTAVNAFKPDLILVSAGFDGHEKDMMVHAHSMRYPLSINLESAALIPFPPLPPLFCLCLSPSS
jgi:hypothetical protein